MADTDTDSSDALNEYASSLEKRIEILEKRIANFRIAGAGIAGNVEQGFTYSDPVESDPDNSAQ